MCQHQPQCPSPYAPGRAAARVVVSHVEQGWSLLCNGVVLFDDTGELLPDRSSRLPQMVGMREGEIGMLTWAFAPRP